MMQTKTTSSVRISALRVIGSGAGFGEADRVHLAGLVGA